MGSEQSRLVKQSVAIPCVPRRSCHEERAWAAKDLVHTEWAEVHTCSLSQWSRRHARVFGFDHKIDYCVPLLRKDKEVYLQHIQPYCTKGYQFKIEKLHQPDGRKKNANYKSIPKIVNKRSCYVYPLFAPTVSIIGYQRNIAILQVVYKKTKEVHFIAIELSTGRHLSVYKDIYISEPCIYEAYVSPDETQYLLRPNFFFAYSRTSDPFTSFAVTKDIAVISIRDYDSRVVNVIEDISNLWYSIAFNPMSASSKIALGNYTSDPMGDNMVLYDIAENRVVKRNHQAYASMSHHLVYNPQGTLVVSLGIRLLSPRVDLMYPIKVLLYSADDLSLVYEIPCSSISVNHFHASLTPLFSKTGGYMAVIGNFGHDMTVYKMPEEKSLKHLCRLAVLELVAEEDVKHLPLPKRMRDYLQFLPQWC